MLDGVGDGHDGLAAEDLGFGDGANRQNERSEGHR